MSTFPIFLSSIYPIRVIDPDNLKYFKEICSMNHPEERVEVSIVVPCYNAESTIIPSLESIVRQTFTNYEVIIIDDGSTDSSLAKLYGFLEGKPYSSKFKVITQQNQGPSKARNRGVELAKGVWVAFLDADDCWFEEKLEIQLKASRHDKEAVLLAVAYEKGKFSSATKVQHVSFNKLLYKNYFSTPAVMAKTDILRINQFDEQQKYSEDYGLWLNIAAQYKCIYINKVLCKSVTSKKQFGASGLSAQLWSMQKGEWSNYTELYKKGYINRFRCFVCYGYSFLKYVLRIVKTKLFKYKYVSFDFC